MPKIIQKDAPELRKVSKSVPVKDIASAKVQALIANMKQALTAEEDGVAIAAPQLGVNLRIFVVSGKVYDLMRGRDAVPENRQPDSVFINPEILKLSRKKEFVEEGCLSVRDIYGKIKRAAKVRIKAYDESGKKFELGASGLLAQIFQHETDHLDGVLFTDSAVELEHYDHTKIKNHAKK